MRRAADLGHPMASYALATWYLFGQEPYLMPDHVEAVRLLKVAAKAHIPSAYYDLAVCYHEGEGVDKDPVAGFENYLRAALHGDEQAVMRVGQAYFFGKGTSEDKRTAEIWFDRAEELGVYEAEDEDETSSARSVV
jgi:TPR repeat protein